MYGKLNTRRRCRCDRVTRRTGLTLTEVIVASALLITAMVPILQALTNSYLGSAMIERRTQSLALVEGKLDEIKARSIYNYAESFTDNNVVLAGAYLGNVTDSGSGSDLRTVTVSVGFDLDADSTLDAEEVAVSLSTLVARRW